MSDTRPLGRRAPEPAPVAPRRFRDWNASRPAESLRRDIPNHLVPVLQNWIKLASQHDNDAPQRVALRLGLPPVSGGRGQFSFLDALCDVGTDPDLLDVVHALLAVHRAPGWARDRRYGQSLSGSDSAHAQVAENYGRLVGDLINSLEDAGSAYTVASDARSLVERVDPTVAEAVEQTIDTAPPTAGELLRDAWRQVYGLHPDPTAGFHDAVRAVEEVACPLVLPEDGAATLGKVIAHLRQGAHLWAFTLVDRNGADSVEPLVGMLDRLWTGQVSRHGGGQKSREQTTGEAQVAVHLAATLVQLLGAGALTRRARP